eukprot:NODE_420_length_2265_cov_212.353601_g391_i0.p1 GENE.NODE_420_length_2265_cov_212.353601_g391_i0~~NODE_420_length_2265_cov_212.353601_g391_i0.p1  ORF type:complete len:710 (+),score=73.35 NODE_420_length_2265_cov_212.353601_g391_i0:57-2186(+)
MKLGSLLFYLIALGVHCQGHSVHEYAEALSKLDFMSVKKDIEAVLTNSQEFWPADYGHYGPLMIRLAWHCSGAYRNSDGRGGCNGARIRFDPERSWPDNTNVEKARRVLWPVKEKYGIGLSWGDLIVLAGDVAIESMGGPILGFCGGRIDDSDGSASAPLGPSPEQEAVAPCGVDGDCDSPLGPTTMGLIYVNPEGPMGQPDPAGSAPEIRDTFARMGMNDVETVALIGGGHSFGKCHGACPNGAGPSPKMDPTNPWPGLCGTGKLADAFTSGFEGPWTHNPIKWDNSFFKILLGHEWEVHTGPGGHFQWRVVGSNPPTAPGPAGGTQPLMMLTTDIALRTDPAYLAISQSFADNESYFSETFARAWYKLTSRDMGPVTRCVGPMVPPPLPFQLALPPPSATPVNFKHVRPEIVRLLTVSNTVSPDMINGRSSISAWVNQLAWNCASTFRVTNFFGGCNGARIRFSPQKDWPENAGMSQVIDALSPIKQRFGPALSWADLIVYAGQVAIEESTGASLEFCPGRTDASDGSGTETQRPRFFPNDPLTELRESQALLGLTARELVALKGQPRSAAYQQLQGYAGSWMSTQQSLPNAYFTLLLGEVWEPYTNPVSGQAQYKARGKDLFMLPTDLWIRYDAEYEAIAQEFASDSQLFLREFQSAWTKVMIADRFKGPYGNQCTADPRKPPSANHPEGRRGDINFINSKCPFAH